MRLNEKQIILYPSATFNYDECLWYLDRGYDECLYQIEDRVIYKALMIEEVSALFRIEFKDNVLVATILTDTVDDGITQTVTNYITDWFDLARDLQPFYTLLHQTAELDYMPTAYRGLHLMGIPDLFETICWCVIGQQINLTFAYRLKRRLIEKLGSYVEYKGKKYYLFPSPKVLLTLSIEELRTMQYTTSKATYLLNVAQAFANGSISKEYLQSLTTMSEKQAHMMSIKGVGLWTANYTLMKCLKEPKSIPYGDAGLLNALIKHKVIEDKKDRETLDKYFESFASWESYLTLYLWRSLAVNPA